MKERSARRPLGALRLAGVALPEFIYPKSAYGGHVRPLEISKERLALKYFIDEQQVPDSSNAPTDSLRRKRKRVQTDEFHQIELHEFSIYRPASKNTQTDELAPLHFLCAKSANNDYYFDGILVDGSKRKYLEKVPFKVLSIGNYLDTSLHTIGDQIWIQTSGCQEKNVWYQLKEPAHEYQEYHKQFLWLAGFTKHFVDFLNCTDKVSLNHFRQNFHDWTHELHGNDEDFKSWFSKYGHTDFRSVVAANFEFLWKEANGVESGLHKHPIWSEVDSKRLTAVKEHFFKIENTVVTPYVYECFKRMPFGEFFNVISQSPMVLASRRKREIKLDLTIDKYATRVGDSDNQHTGPSSISTGGITRASHTGEFNILNDIFDEKMSRKDNDHAEQDRIEARANAARQRFVGTVVITPQRIKRDKFGRVTSPKPEIINAGDVVAVKKDVQSVWKGKSEFWFAYVQRIYFTEKGRRVLKVIWLYEPSDTSCSTGYYPILNELFFSDNCNCADEVLDAHDVICTVPAALFSNPGESGAEYFVRQKYIAADACFVTLKQSDLKCKHSAELGKSPTEEAKEKYQIGDTVLILKNNVLEPVQVTGFSNDKLLVRQLRRRSRDYPPEQARPNELVWTEEICSIEPDDIDRKCHVRFYTEDEKANGKIPAPYNRDGTADAYFITSGEVRDGAHTALKPLEKPFPPMNQGFDPAESSPRPVMYGMDLFCGGGNFGRGLEEGGAVHNKWAVDIGKEQVHTYRANLRNPEDTNLYFGSVNDVLRNALKGNFSAHVPEPGDVDFISAGSPCQGFSNANGRREEEKGLRNSSLVASVAAFVDFYRPKYALLENVAGMASKNSGNAFSQLLCALVGMGYQVQQFNLDAWSFGSPQSRSRIFISIAAPGLKLPPHPALSHSHPEGKGDRGIGVGANGEKFGKRQFAITPFKYITATQATSDLPFVGQARSHTCIKYPDHRQTTTKGNLKRILVNSIPVHPRQQSFIKAVSAGRMPKQVIANHTWGSSGHRQNLNSKSWQRIDPNGLIPTVTTSPHPACAFVGATLHWDEHRLLTIMEARRAQGFPDNEVLIGIPSAQWKIVGNSVARPVALALGMSLRYAWLSNDHDDAPSHYSQRVMVETGSASSSSVDGAAASKKRKLGAPGESDVGEEGRGSAKKARTLSDAVTTLPGETRALVPPVEILDDSHDGLVKAGRTKSQSSTVVSPSDRAQSLLSISEASGAPMSISTTPPPQSPPQKSYPKIY